MRGRPAPKLQRILVLEEPVMHATEVALITGCFRRFSRQGRVGVDIGQWQVPPHETQLAVEPFEQLQDDRRRRPAVRTLVVAVRRA